MYMLTFSSNFEGTVHFPCTMFLLRSVMFLMNNHIVDIVFGRNAEKIQGICETKDVKVLVSKLIMMKL